MTGDWRQSTLGEVARWGSGGTPQAGNSAYYGGDIPWAVIGDLNDAVVSRTAANITEEGLRRSSAKLVPAGAVLVAMYGSIGKLGVAGVRMATNQAIAFALPHEFVDRDFLFYYLLSQRHELDGAGKGATQRNIGQAILKAWPIRYPSLLQQRRIVAILEEHLSDLDAADSSFRRASARCQALVTRSLSLVRSGHELPLPQVAVIQGGIQKQAKRTPHRNAFPFLRVANVTAHGLELDHVHRIELFDGELTRYGLHAGDLLVVEGNGSPSQIGRAALWDGSIPDCVHQNHLIRVRPDREKILPEYLEAVWNSPETRSVLTQVASSSSGLHTLSVRKLAQLQVPVPSLERQIAAVAELRQVRESVTRLQASISASAARGKSLRRAVLAAAFAGRLSGHGADNVVVEELAEEESA